MNKNYKNYIIIFLVLIIIIGGYFLYQTYAKYITSLSSDTDMGIARWNIKINNSNVTNGSNFSNIITPVFTGTQNIAPNVIAPTAEGYFDIELDATNTDVSLRYTITTSENENSAVSDLIISGYSINGGEKQSVTTNQENNEENNDFRIENTIAYNSENKVINIRVFLKWNDDPEQGATMNNSDDTQTTTNPNNKAKINVNFNIIQIPN